MIVAVCNALGTVILSGVVLVLTQGLFQGGDASLVLGVNGDVVKPLLAAVGGIGSVYSGHRDGNEEGINGGGDHLGNLALHQQIQAEFQIGGAGMTVRVGFWHCGSVLCVHVSFQSILDAGRIGCQSSREGIDQGIALKEVISGFGELGGDSIGVVVAQTNRGKQVCRLAVVELVEHHILVDAVGLGFGIGHDLGHAEILELNALDGVAIALLAIAQVVDGAIVHHGFKSAVAHAGGNIAVDHSGGSIVSVGHGQIILVQVDGATLIRVDGGIGDGSRACDGGEGENDGNGHHDCADALKSSFHIHFPFFLACFVWLGDLTGGSRLFREHPGYDRRRSSRTPHFERRPERIGR